MMRAAPTDAWGPLPPHADPPRRSSRLRWVERLLLLVAVVSLGYYSYATVEARLYQEFENQQLDAILRSAPAPAPITSPAVVRRSAPRAGDALGRVEIPRLGVSTIVRAGTDARTLSLAVGHISGTALPGENGNVGLAGHRDTFFRRLRNIRSGDDIRVVTPDGTYVYRVEGTRIVNPSDVWVLDPTGRPALTLVTCYPFSYIGSAPQRFIVRAVLTSPTRAASRASSLDGKPL
jgi:sortase A